MDVESLPIETLIPYARNARTHSDAQVAQIAASIREFGFCNPVLVDEQDGIIAGHGRVLAARKLNLDKDPVRPPRAPHRGAKARLRDRRKPCRRAAASAAGVLPGSRRAGSFRTPVFDSFFAPRGPRRGLICFKFVGVTRYTWISTSSSVCGAVSRTPAIWTRHGASPECP
jgi:hypothetical protein